LEAEEGVGAGRTIRACAHVVASIDLGLVVGVVTLVVRIARAGASEEPVAASGQLGTAGPAFGEDVQAEHQLGRSVPGEGHARLLAHGRVRVGNAARSLAEEESARARGKVRGIEVPDRMPEAGRRTVV